MAVARTASWIAFSLMNAQSTNPINVQASQALALNQEMNVHCLHLRVVEVLRACALMETAAPHARRAQSMKTPVIQAH
jgi:hypothetical protein